MLIVHTILFPGQRNIVYIPAQKNRVIVCTVLSKKNIRRQTSCLSVIFLNYCCSIISQSLERSGFRMI